MTISPQPGLTKRALNFFFFGIFANLIGEELYPTIVLIWTCFYLQGLAGVRWMQCRRVEYFPGLRGPGRARAPDLICFNLWTTGSRERL